MVYGRLVLLLVGVVLTVLAERSGFSQFLSSSGISSY